MKVMFCSKCGSQLPEKAKFCAVCGEPVEQSASGAEFGGVRQQSRQPQHQPQYQQPMESRKPPEFESAPQTRPAVWQNKKQALRIPLDSKLPAVSGALMLAALAVTIVTAVLPEILGWWSSDISSWFIYAFESNAFLLFAIFAFAVAKRNVKLFIIPLALDVFILLISVSSSIFIFYQYGYGNIFDVLLRVFNVSVVVGLILRAAMLTLFCLTASGAIRSKAPFVIVCAVLIAAEIAMTVPNALMMIGIGNEFRWITYQLTGSFAVLLRYAAYMILGLALSGDPTRRYHQRNAPAIAGYGDRRV
jgi:hypothetical protein